MTKNQNETVLKMDREDLENEKKNELFRNGSTCTSKHNVQKRMNLKQIFKE